MSEQSAADLSAAWKIVIISFLACILGMMIKAREYRGQPSKPWPFIQALKRLIYGAPSHDLVSSSRDGNVVNYNIDGMPKTLLQALAERQQKAIAG